MYEKIKTDYLKFIFHKTNVDLTRYNISGPDKEFINGFFERIISSENLPRDLYIISQIKELKNIGKYFIYILKKIEDKVIDFDNLSQNLNSDAEFIENEILNYLSNPKLRDIIEHKYEQDNDAGQDRINEEYKDKENNRTSSFEETGTEEDALMTSKNITEEAEEEKDLTSFRENYLDKKNYLELIQSEETSDENVFQLPTTEGGDSPGDPFELPATEGEKISEGETEGEAEEETEEEKLLSLNEQDNKNEKDAFEKTEEEFTEDTGSSFSIKGKVTEVIAGKSEDEIFDRTLFDNNEETKNENDNESINESEESEESAGDGIVRNEDESYDAENTEEINFDPAEEEREIGKIRLSDEIAGEITTYEEEQKNRTSEENIFEEEESVVVEPPANEGFLEYENQIKEKNIYLNEEFESMINILDVKPSNDEERTRIIKNILSSSTQLEKISRDMSLEIISNIYQTITLSFEKISEGKYDISQSTLNLFKNGLSLVLSLINGDDYFGYKDILKSIENIRNALIEEKEKREHYMRQKQEKSEQEKRLSLKYPDDEQRIRITAVKKLIKETEVNFNNIDKISGEYQIYEALRSLSGSLNNFKEIVKLSKELQMKKLVQLSEASYIFVKFLQNYRINPVTTEIKEIFGYIIYNLKSVVVEKEVTDIDLFISYLNDPVKIFSKPGKKKN